MKKNMGAPEFALKLTNQVASQITSSDVFKNIMREVSSALETAFTQPTGAAAPSAERIEPDEPAEMMPDREPVIMEGPKPAERLRTAPPKPTHLHRSPVLSGELTMRKAIMLSEVLDKPLALRKRQVGR